MERLTRIPQIASIMPNLPNWITGSDATIQQSSLLGQLFAFSPLAHGASDFKDLRSMSDRDKLSREKAVQEALRWYQRFLYHICKRIVESGKPGQTAVLDWFSAALSVGKRTSTNIDSSTVATDGFMYNIVAVLNRFTRQLVHGDVAKLKVRIAICTDNDRLIRSMRTIFVLFPSDARPLALSLRKGLNW